MTDYFEWIKLGFIIGICLMGIPIAKAIKNILEKELKKGL